MELERNLKISNRVGSFLALKSNINKNVWKILSRKSQRIKNTNLVNENELFEMPLNNVQEPIDVSFHRECLNEHDDESTLKKQKHKEIPTQ